MQVHPVRSEPNELSLTEVARDFAERIAIHAKPPHVTASLSLVCFSDGEGVERYNVCVQPRRFAVPNVLLSVHLDAIDDDSIRRVLRRELLGILPPLVVRWGQVVAEKGPKCIVICGAEPRQDVGSHGFSLAV